MSEQYNSALNQFNKQYRNPLETLLLRAIRERLLKIDGRLENEISATSRIYERDTRKYKTSNCLYECVLPFVLPYSEKAVDNGDVCRENKYLFLSSGVDCGAGCLFLSRIGTWAEGEDCYYIEVRREDYQWLYRKLLRMGFFDDRYKDEFRLHKD